MTEHDYGPLRAFEIVWKSGHIETVQGHQVQYSGGDTFSGMFGQPARPVRFRIYGMFPGDNWRMVLSGLEDDVSVIRDVTTPEQLLAPEQDGPAGE